MLYKQDEEDKNEKRSEKKPNETKNANIYIIYILYTKEIEFIATQLNFYVCVDDD